MIEGSYQGFEVEIDAGIATLTLTKPERLNAMSFGTRRDLVEVLTLAQFDDDVRVLIVTGTGRGFCAGVDNRSLMSETPTVVQPRPTTRDLPVTRYGQLTHFSQALCRTVRRLDKPTIAAVNGFAIQIGLSFALSCDYLIAARSARLGSATLRMAYMPDEGGHWLLVQHLGVRRAFDFIMRNRIVDADEAVALGLANEVVDDELLLPRARELAEELAAGPQVAMRFLKKAIYQAAELTFDQAGEDIAVRTAYTDFHPDAIDGAPAFFERRSPVFNRWLEEDDDERG